MKVHIASLDGSGLPFAMQAQDEGHRTTMSIKEPDAQKIGVGLVRRTSPDVTCDLAIFDMVGMGRLADGMRNRCLVMGDSLWADRLEKDRSYGLSFMDNVPPTHNFADKRQALQWLKSNPGRYAAKFDVGPTDSTYVGKTDDGSDMTAWLKWCPYNGPMMLQEYVHGITLSTEGWYSKGVSLGYNHTMEVKKLATGDLGPSTGCMANVVWAASDDDNYVKQAFNDRLLETLWKIKYSGPLDFNGIIDDNGVYRPLEWCSRMGYDAIWSQTRELMDEDFIDFAARVAEGTDDPLELRDGFAFALRTIVLPKNGKIPDYIIDLPEDNDRVLYQDVMRDAAGNLRITGYDGQVCIITSWSADLESCSDDAYKIAESLTVPELIWRTDGLDRVLKEYPKLKF